MALSISLFPFFYRENCYLHILFPRPCFYKYIITKNHLFNYKVWTLHQNQGKGDLFRMTVTTNVSNNLMVEGEGG